MNKKRLIAIFAVLCIVIIPVIAQDVNNELDLGWYSIEDWEWNTCEKWGGPYQSSSAGESGLGVINLSKYFTSSLIVTMQAEILEAAPSNASLPDETKLYAISWYVQPIAESVHFTVTAQGLPQAISSTSATLDAPGFGYEVIQSADPIGFAKLEVQGGPSWTIPFV